MFKLVKYLKTHIVQTILIPIFLIFEVVGEVLIPFYIGKLIDDGIKGGQPELIYKYGLIMAGLAVMALVFGIIGSRLGATVSHAFARNMRQAQFENIQTFSFENIDKFSTSSLITRLTLDVSMVQNAFQMAFRTVFRAPSLFIISITMAFIVGGKMGFIFVAVAPILILGFFIVMKGAHKHFTKMFVKIDNLNLVTQEDLSGIRTVKSFVREDYEIGRFKFTVNDVADNSIKAQKWVIFNSPIMQFTAGLSFLLIGWFGARNMVYYGFTEGQFTNIIAYVMQILFSLMMISQIFMFLVISRAAVIRINEVLEEETTLKEVDSPLTKLEDGSIIFEDVNFKYFKEQEKMVLNNINLKIPSGAFVGLFGATGTGKTSLVQLIPRLYDVSDGNVYVGGNNVKDYKLNVIRKEAMIVLQKNVLFSGSLKENMKYGNPDATDEEIIEALKKAQAWEFVSEWKELLDYKIEQGGVNLSGGQRQRVTIARALIGKPKILILDDSTSAVDTKTDALLQETFKLEQPDMTKIIVSQRVSSIQDADMIVILDDYGINGIGTHEELYKTNEIYRSICLEQRKGNNNNA